MMKNHYQKQESGVSPVVGVMLMLVVTIIIAAVVSAFAGGLSTGQKDVPKASFQTTIKNGGGWGNSMFDMRVLATDKGIPTKDIKIVTSWTSKDGYSNYTVITGPSPGAPNTITTGGTKRYHSPVGHGEGVSRDTPDNPGGSSLNGTPMAGEYWVTQHFGNYSLVAGTSMHNSPAGSMTAGNPGYGQTSTTKYQYTYGATFLETDVDGMMAILGRDWNHLRGGDVVSVKLIHIPSQKVLYDENIVVEGSQ